MFVLSSSVDQVFGSWIPEDETPQTWIAGPRVRNVLEPTGLSSYCWRQTNSQCESDLQKWFNFDWTKHTLISTIRSRLWQITPLATATKNQPKQSTDHYLCTFQQLLLGKLDILLLALPCRKHGSLQCSTIAERKCPWLQQRHFVDGIKVNCCIFLGLSTGQERDTCYYGKQKSNSLTGTSRQDVDGQSSVAIGLYHDLW